VGKVQIGTVTQWKSDIPKHRHAGILTFTSTLSPTPLPEAMSLTHKALESQNSFSIPRLGSLKAQLR
jgi:hypothetical protein